jgi:HSP20 family protein
MNLVRRNRDRDYGLSTFDQLQREINRLFDVDWPDGESGILDRGFTPRVDIEERENDVVVTCEVPGVDKKDLDISVSGNLLSIQGEKRYDHEEKEKRYYRRESFAGSFQRTVPLPETVDAEHIDAQLKNGILTLTLPKKAEAKPRRIEVKTG